MNRNDAEKLLYDELHKIMAWEEEEHKKTVAMLKAQGRSVGEFDPELVAINKESNRRFFEARDRIMKQIDE